MEKHVVVQNYLNLAIMESELEKAKKNGFDLSIIKFKYDVDLDNTFFFKSLMAELIKLFQSDYIFYDNKNGFIVFLKNRKLHQSVALFGKVKNKIYNEYKISIDRAGITTLSENDSLDDFLKRVDRYFVISKRLREGKVVYGSREFDFFNERKREDTFSEIISTNPKVKIYNLYNGIPVSDNAVIVKKSDEKICLQTSKEELLFLKRFEKFLYIKHQEFPNILKGEIAKIDLDKELVWVNNIIFQDISTIDRENIRITPQKKIYITIEYQNKIIAQGDIISLSVDALLVKVDKNSIKKLRALEKIEFVLKFRLFSKNSSRIENISLKAKIFKTYGDEVVFSIFPNNFIQGKIANYVSEVKEDILKTLKKQIMAK